MTASTAEATEITDIVVGPGMRQEVSRGDTTTVGALVERAMAQDGGSLPENHFLLMNGKSVASGDPLPQETVTVTVSQQAVNG